MATITVGHLPGLTAAQAMETFARDLSGTYEVYPATFKNRDFVLKKSDWQGVGVRLKQGNEKTTFVFTAMLPNSFIQGYAGGLVSYIFLRSSWKELENEVADFIATCPDFQPDQRHDDAPVQLLTPAAAAAKATEKKRAA
jgi:hypothetical protein